MKPIKTQNPRAKHSQKCLQDAFLRLLNRKPYRKITVQSIVQEANLARSTFYVHFETKEDLISSYFDNLYEEVYPEFIAALQDNVTFSDSFLLLNQTMFKMLKPHAPLWLALRQAKVDYLLFKQLHRYHKLFLTILKEHFHSHESISKELDYALEYMAGGFFALTIRWIENGMVESAEEIAQILDNVEKLGLWKVLLNE